MTEKNKQTLLLANAAVGRGDYEGFLLFCTEDTIWNFVGEQVLRGKEAVRRYITDTYLEPPVVEVERLLAEGDFLTAIGKIKLVDKDGAWTAYDYCDVWKLREGKLQKLRAFVVPYRANAEPNAGDGIAEKTVIGSGYSYDEPACPTDRREPMNVAKAEQVVGLPDLGKPMHP